MARKKSLPVENSSVNIGKKITEEKSAKVSFVKKNPTKKITEEKLAAKLKVAAAKLTKKTPRKKIEQLTYALQLKKPKENPIIAPKGSDWESYQVFNPAAILNDGVVHLLYRALGPDYISRLGYAESRDGINIDKRLSEPVYTAPPVSEISDKPYYALAYNSGGGWAGCEDPRLTKIANVVYMLYVAFDGATLPRIAITSIPLKDFIKNNWKWSNPKLISPPGVVDKSGVLFPEKIGGKYVIMHRIFPNILIDFIDDLEFKNGEYLKGKYSIKVRKNKWDSRKIGAGAPPIKTKYGWLLFYYGVDDRDASQYKIGAMLLDLKNPTKVLHRSNQPILEPTEWYENQGHKAGVAYPCGAVLKGNDLFVYYGGADTNVCAATAKLDSFLKDLVEEKSPKLKNIGTIK